MTERPEQSAAPARKGPRRKSKKLPDKLIEVQEAELLEVYPDQAGLRLDQFLKLKLRWRSRTKVQELIEERAVTVNGQRLDRSYRVKLGEIVRLPVPPPPPEQVVRMGEIQLDILHEDDQLIILNKPPDLVVHPAGKHKYDTLINALHLRYRDREDPAKDVIPKLAHRIDRETSGVLIALKTRRTDRRVPMVFEHAEVRKEYLTIAEGVLREDSGVIDLPIGREEGAEDFKSGRVVREDGQSARTGFEVVERFKGFTLVRCRLFTGRMHQIRVHLKAVGHPVLCDKLYGLRAEFRLSEARAPGAGEADAVLISRQALHAHRLTFEHPATGKPMTVEAPLPEDMRRTVEALRGT
jgi:23S rRNA pseudouridine1911/1915/1917 synthase